MVKILLSFLFSLLLLENKIPVATLIESWVEEKKTVAEWNEINRKRTMKRRRVLKSI